jgi:hypothetical protein
MESVDCTEDLKGFKAKLTYSFAIALLQLGASTSKLEGFFPRQQIMLGIRRIPSAGSTKNALKGLPSRASQGIL